MKRITGLATAGLLLTAGIVVLAGCTEGAGAHRHEMAPRQGDQHMQCRLCYDEVTTFRESTGKGLTWTRNSVIRKHQCAGCRTEMTIYDEDGTPMVKCEGCAPEGIACSRCKPPREE